MSELTERSIHSVIEPLLEPILASQRDTTLQLQDLSKSLGRIVLIEERQLNDKERTEDLNRRCDDLKTMHFHITNEMGEKIHAIQMRLNALEPKVDSTTVWVNKALTVFLTLGLAAGAYVAAVVYAQ